MYGLPDKATELGLQGYASEYDNDDEHDLLDLYLTGDFDLFGRTHEFVIGANRSTVEGVEKSLYDYTTGAGFPALPAFNTWDGNTPKPVFADQATGSDTEREQMAYYFTARLSLTDEFHLTLGGRYNDWEVKGVSYGKAQDAADKEFIPYIGGVYQFTENTVAYASYTETFVSQTELDIDNNVLAPITGKSQEAGIKTSLFDDKFVATFAYFETKQVNVATPDPATAGLPPEEARYIGSDGIESSGYEFDLAGELLPGLQTSIGYTNFDIKGDQAVKDYTPEALFKLAANYTIPSIEKLSVGVNLRWQDDISRTDAITPPYPTAGMAVVTKQDAYTVVGLMANYQINDNVNLRINANNVTDEKYYNSLYWAQAFYAAPANYSMTLTWSM